MDSGCGSLGAKPSVRNGHERSPMGQAGERVDEMDFMDVMDDMDCRS